MSARPIDELTAQIDERKDMRSQVRTDFGEDMEFDALSQISANWTHGEECSSTAFLASRNSRNCHRFSKRTME